MAELYRYPLTKLTSSDDYLKITAIEYVAPGFSTQEDPFKSPTAGDPRDKKVEKAIFILPIPDDINQTNTTGWGVATINPLQTAAAGVVEDVIEGKFKGLPEKAMNALKDVTSGNGIKFGAAFLVKEGTNKLFNGGLTIDQTLSRFAGTIINPNVELLFTSVNLRSQFIFGFDMVPRSQKEAQMIKQIFKTFKKLSAAKNQAGGGAFIKAPDVFKIEYMSGNSRHPYLNRFKICALTGVTINYTDGTYATYPDGAPVAMKLGLSFQELSPIYADDYKDSTEEGYDEAIHGGTGF